ncbi:H/ACA ribonucleoprotein complex subunit 2-like protein [Portunus trituberculatus]|uniref:H/ACA ribonucleoprotein complex subunit 2-like protein n=1 Tax=Portunus trituberculatus TaxID=210409 RepID=UPI001E1CEDFD|nr:H/ACA ribonucleoprotein complex subunit 2-like protein [Portunus trituberculatus]
MDTSIVGEEEKEGEVTYEEKLKYVSVIAQPMASKKLTSRIYKLIKKASKHKLCVRDGLKDVQARIRRGETGIVILAGNASPIEVMCHLPAVCEEKEIPYIYTPSREDLGAALGTRRGCLVILIQKNDEYQESYDKVLEDINKVPRVY